MATASLEVVGFSNAEVRFEITDGLDGAEGRKEASPLLSRPIGFDPPPFASLKNECEVELACTWVSLFSFSVHKVVSCEVRRILIFRSRFQIRKRDLRIVKVISICMVVLLNDALIIIHVLTCSILNSRFCIMISLRKPWFRVKWFWLGWRVVELSAG